jgi:hypothetical protein
MALIVRILPEVEGMIYRFGACRYDRERHELWRNHQKVVLERQVREVLLYFSYSPCCGG